MELSEIERILPHRRPFLFVDRIEKADRNEIIGYRRFTEREEFLEGHFPGRPVVPGVILIETMAQCGGAGICLLGKIKSDRSFFLAAIEKARFLREVRPNEEVKLVIENLRVTNWLLKQGGKAFVGDELVAEAEWLSLSPSESQAQPEEHDRSASNTV